MTETMGFRENKIRVSSIEDMSGCIYYEWQMDGEYLYIPDGRKHYIWKDRLYTFSYEKKVRSLQCDNKLVCGVCIAPFYVVTGTEDRIIAFFREITNMSSSEERSRYFRRNWMQVFSVKRVHPLLTQIIGIIEESKGRAMMENIADELDYSTRQMETVFQRQYGYGPKFYSRIIRLHTAINSMLQYPEYTLAYIAEQTGYSDPSHFQREFKRFVGMTPKLFLQEYVRYSSEQIYNSIFKKDLL